jgi:UbiD family decarboxylase
MLMSKSGQDSRTAGLKSFRDTLAWLGDDVHVIKAPVDPLIEAATIAKRFDDSKVLVAENVARYPNARLTTFLYGSKERTARIFGVDRYEDAKFKVLDAYRNPIAPREVAAVDAPCQEVVISGDEIGDIHNILPVTTHTPGDGARVFGSGVHFFGPPWVPQNGTQFAFYRMAFQNGGSLASINMTPGGHGDNICRQHRGKKIPCTVNICPPPAIELMGTSIFNGAVFPGFTNEIGMAGALQGFPVDIVKAKTVDAYSIAQSEWVIEGYVLEGERVWETPEAAASGQQGETDLHPEWTRFMGKAYRTPRAFQATAITCRRDKPYFGIPVLGAIWYAPPFIAASVYELCNRLAPGFVQDVAVWTGLTTFGGMIVKVKKQRRSDEGLQRNILTAIMGTHRGLRLCVVVDEDIDIWQPEDVIWAIESRVSPRRDVIVFNENSRGQAYQPSDQMMGGVVVSDGGLGIDATVPLDQKELFARARYPVEALDLSRWFTEAEVRDLQSRQDPYFKFLGQTGYV